MRPTCQVVISACSAKMSSCVSSAAAVPADDEVVLFAGAVLAPVAAVAVEVVDAPVAAAVVAGRGWLLAVRVVLSIGNRARRTRRYSATPGRRAWCAIGLFHGLVPGARRCRSVLFGNAVESGRMSSSVLTSQVVVPTCPNLPHLGHILPTFRTGFGRKNPARLPRNSVIIICIGSRVDQGPLGCREGLAVRCANRVASTRYIPSLAFESIPRRHSRIPAHPARLSKKTEPNEGPEPTSLLVRPLS